MCIPLGPCRERNVTITATTSSMTTSTSPMGSGLLQLMSWNLTAECEQQQDGQDVPHPDFNTIIDDLSNVSFINELWEVASTSEIVVKSVLFVPVVIWGILGNLSLIYVVVRNRHLQSPTNLLICNMALADLLSLLIHPWVFLINDFFQNYQLGEFGCKVEAAIECALLLTSVMNLSAISYDRLTAIVLLQDTKLTDRGVKLVMGVTWIAGLIIATPLFFLRTYKERQWSDFLEKYCTENTIVTNIYWHVIITVMVWLPLIIMLACYITIFVKLSRYERDVRSRARARATQARYRAKVARTMFTVVIVFIICHLPFTALIFYRNKLLQDHVISSPESVQNVANGNYQIFWFVSKYMMFINAGANPVIYGLLNEKFRRVFKSTPVVKWIFLCRLPSKKRVTIVLDDDNKPCKSPGTKETVVVDTNKPPNKLFTIFKTPFYKHTN